AVADGPTEKAEREGRCVADEAHGAEPGRLAGEGIDEPAQGDRLDPEPEVREQRAGPEEAVVTGAAEGAEHGRRRSPRGAGGGKRMRLFVEPSASGTSAPMRVWPGVPDPPGATWDREGVNFALFSENATAVDRLPVAPAGDR